MIIWRIFAMSLSNKDILNRYVRCCLVQIVMFLIVE